MSNNARHLADWLQALFDALANFEPHRAELIQSMVGQRSAKMCLDHDWARVCSRDNRLVAERLPNDTPLEPPFGVTKRSVVAALLRGHLEVLEGITEGYLKVRGTPDEVVLICHAIEFLVDASTRIPKMQRLSSDFLKTQHETLDWQILRQRRIRRGKIKDAERDFLRREGLVN